MVLQLVTLCLCVTTDFQQLGIPCLGVEVLPAPNLLKLLDYLHLVWEFAQLYESTSGEQNSEVTTCIS